ncbi:MFS transporter [Kitasatospora sp. P5_F3]
MTATHGLAGRREWTGLAVLLLPTLVLSMDMGILFFGLPFISKELQPSGTQQLWIMDMYSFVLAGLLIPMGALGDRIGRRKLLMAGAAGFAAASVLAATADGAGQLIAARALLGLTGATLMPSTMALIRNMFHDPKQRQAAMGAWSGVLMAGATLGPVAGGLLLEHFHWGAVFLCAVPVMLLVLLAAPALLPEYKAPKAGSFDLLGAVLSVAAVLPVVYGIKQLAVEGWDLTAALAIVGGLVLVGLLILRLRTAATPLLDLALFRNPIFTGAVSVNTIAMLAMMGFSLFTSQYLQLVRGFSPLTAALWALLPSVGVGAAVGISGALAGKIRPAVQMAGGMVVGAIGFGILTQVQVDSPLALILVGAGVLAAGSVSTVMQTAELVVSAAPADQAGAASATSETASELGGSLGIAVLGAAGAAVYSARLDGTLPAGLSDSALTVAQDTLGGAVTVASELPADLAEQLLGATRIAFTDGLHLAAAVGVLCLLAGSAVAYRLLGSLPANRAEEIPEEQLTAAPQHIPAA